MGSGKLADATAQTRENRRKTACPETLIKPRALRKGDTVGIIAPSTPPFEPGDLQFTYRWLARLGLKHKVGEHVFDTWSDFAGRDEARLADLHKYFADPEVAAILPVRGGNGASRLLPGLDFALIAANPKIFIGYSDITGLLVPITQRTGLVTFHGPTAGSFYRSGYTYNNYVKALFSTKPLGLVGDPEPKDDWKPEYPPTRMLIAEGAARGQLAGGCLTLLRQSLGSPYEIDTAGKIVFIEDVQEEPHNIDRMLTQLLLCGKLKDAAGILVGECAKCKPGESGRNALSGDYSVEEVLRERLGKLGIPVIYGLRFGHGAQQMTLPLGVQASLEASGKSVKVKIEESATI